MHIQRTFLCMIWQNVPFRYHCYYLLNNLEENYKKHKLEYEIKLETDQDLVIEVL